MYDFRDPKWNCKLTQIIRKFFLKAIGVQRLYNKRRIIALEQGVIKPGGMGQIPRHTDMHASQPGDNHPHRGSGMPYPLQPMAPGTNNQWIGLPSPCPVPEGGYIVAQKLKGAEQVIKIVKLREGAKTPQCEPHTLAYYRCFPDTRITHSVLPIRLLHTDKAEIDIPKLSDIFAKSDYVGIFFKKGVKVISQNDPSVNFNRGGTVNRFYFFNTDR